MRIGRAKPQVARWLARLTFTMKERMAAAARLESAMDFLRRTQGAPGDETAMPRRATEPEPVSEPKPPPGPGRFRRGIARLFSLGR